MSLGVYDKYIIDIEVTDELLESAYKNEFSNLVNIYVEICSYNYNDIYEGYDYNDIFDAEKSVVWNRERVRELNKEKKIKRAEFIEKRDQVLGKIDKYFIRYLRDNIDNCNDEQAEIIFDFIEDDFRLYDYDYDKIGDRVKSIIWVLNNAIEVFNRLQFLKK